MELEKVTGGWANKQYAKHLWVRYKITLEQFNRIWEWQGGICAGCEQSFAHPVARSLEVGLRPEVDHCHETGKVRGLLCRRCNDFLGKVQDNQELLKRLLEYLKRNGERG